MSPANSKALLLLKSFTTLKANWDSYGAEVPSDKAIQKASTFILRLSNTGIDVYFVAPSPNGDILIEIKQGSSSLEFEFTSDESDSVVASQFKRVITEAELNETTLIAYLKWLICPYGNCPPDLR